MALKLKEFVNEINSTQLALEGKLFIIDRNGKREEHYIESEVVKKEGFLSTTIEWTEKGKKQYKLINDIKSINGIQKSNFS